VSRAWFAVTGGVLTSGGVANFCDGSQVRAPLGEVSAEIVSDLDAWGAIGHGKSSVFHYEPMSDWYEGRWRLPMFDATDTESLTAAEMQGRRRMMEVMDFHQRVQKKPRRLDHCSPIIGIREGARIMGAYVLTVDDLRAGRAFDDGVARGTFYLDGHKPDDDKRTCILPKDQLAVQ